MTLIMHLIKILEELFNIDIFFLIVGFIGFFVSLILLIITFFKHGDKKIPTIALISSIIIFLIGSMLSENTETVDTNQISDTQFATDDDIISFLYEINKGNLGDGESITDITYSNRTITVYIDLDSDDFGLAVDRANGITDAILKNENFDDVWDNIKLVFDGIGYIEYDKSMIVESDYGRYMDMKDSMLKSFN